MSTLIIAAHYDDIEIGMGGTLHSLVSSGCKVDTFTLCGGSDISDDSHNIQIRENIFRLNTNGLTSTDYTEEFNSLTLHQNIASVQDSILELIKNTKPTTIYVPGVDQHRDHNAINEAISVILNKTNSTIKYPIEVYAYNINSFYLDGSYNVFHQLNDDDIAYKQRSIAGYKIVSNIDDYINDTNCERFNLIKMIK
jgi:hypothetical protein